MELDKVGVNPRHFSEAVAEEVILPVPKVLHFKEIGGWGTTQILSTQGQINRSGNSNPHKEGLIKPYNNFFTTNAAGITSLLCASPRVWADLYAKIPTGYAAKY